MIHLRMANALKAMLFASVLAALTLSAQEPQETPASVDTAFERFWAAGSPVRAERRFEAVVGTGVSLTMHTNGLHGVAATVLAVGSGTPD